MIKSSVDQEAQSKQSISTSTLFKKTPRLNKKNKKKEEKQRSTLKPKHPLAAALNNAIDQSKQQIKARANSDLSSILDSFLIRLDNDEQHCAEQAQRAIATIKAITQPLDEMELEWESNDKSRSGKTTLGNRIKKLEKVVKAEEASIARETQELHDLNLELDKVVTEIMGDGGCEQAINVDNGIPGVLDWSHWDPQQGTVVAHKVYPAEVEMEMEKAHWADVIEATNKTAMNAMKESEMELNLRQDKIQQSFYKLLRDEDYY